MENQRPFAVMLPFLATVVFVLLTGLIAKIQEKFTFRQMTVGLVLTVAVFAITHALVLAFNRYRNESQIEFILNQLRGVASLIHFPWLCDDEALAKKESEVTGDSIWIISPDLVNVTEKDVIIQAVKHNIARGITYTYIMPKSRKISLALPHLEQLAKRHKNRLRKILLPEDEFRMISVTHIAVFNAGARSDMSSLQVFIELPIQESDGKRIRGHWAQVEKEAAKDLAGRFSEIVREHYPEDPG